MKKNIMCKLLTGILAVVLAVPVSAVIPGASMYAQAAAENEFGQTTKVGEHGLEVTGVLQITGFGTYYVNGESECMDVELENGEIRITKGYNLNGHITIPAYIDGYPVTKLGNDEADVYNNNAFSVWYNNDLSGITIPDTVKTLGEYLFGDQENLIEVILPDSVISISKSCFAYSGVKKVILSNSMKEIPLATFTGCNNLTEVVLPQSIIKIGAEAFDTCSSLEKIIIPSSVNQIDRRAFVDCTSLKEIVIPEGVTKIADNTFSGCTSLESITIPASVTTISSFAFGIDGSGATSLKEVNYTGSKEQWDAINMGSGTKKSIKEKATVACADGTKIVNGVATSGSTGNNGTNNNTGEDGTGEATTAGIKVGYIITKNNVKYKVTSIASGNRTASVSGVSSKTLTSAAIPKTVTIGGQSYKVTAIAANAFNGCKKLKTVSIASNVKTIGNKAFYNCTALKTVNGCSGVTSIGTTAFYNCKVLTTVKGCAKVTAIKSKAFYKCVKLVAVGNKSNVVTLSKAKTIGSSAFSGCKAIKKVNLTSTALTKISDSAFSGCTAMTSFAANSTKLTGIGKKAFYGDKKLSAITLKTTKLKSSAVGSSAFKGIKSACTFKVPSSRLDAYKKVFSGRGAGSKITVKKL